MNVREACEGVLNASPMDYEAACEVWTRVCTPQAVLAALQQLEAERDQYRRDFFSEQNRVYAAESRAIKAEREWRRLDGIISNALL